VAANEIVDHHLALVGILETHDWIRCAWRWRREFPATAVVAGLDTFGALFFPQRFDALPGAVAVVCLPLCQQPLNLVVVQRHALGLVEGALVVVEPEPGHALEDGVYRSLGGTLPVGVLDAQDKAPAAVAGIEPAKQRCARAAHVQQSGGAGRESGAYAHYNRGSKLQGISGGHYRRNCD
jgi:hypothetical protein